MSLKENIKDRPFIVGICGGSASGKTSIANIIHKRIGFENCLLFSMDNYYKGPTPEERKKIEEYNFDCPYAIDMDLLYEHLKLLSENQEIDMPVYEFNGSYRKNETNKVKPKKIIILEGILAFHDARIKNLMDVKVFVNLDADLRFARRIERDLAERGRILVTVINRYLKFVKTAFQSYIFPTKQFADLVIPNGAENTIAVDIISDFLQMHLHDIYGKKEKIDDGYFQRKENKMELKDMFHPINLDLEFEEKKDELSQTLYGYINEKFTKRDLEIYHKILLNFINDRKICYYKLYLQFLLTKLLELLDKIYGSNNYVIIKDDNFKVEELEKYEGKHKVLFFPFLLKYNEKIQNIIHNLNTPITFSSIFLTESCNKIIYEANRNIKFISIYYGDTFKNYEEFLENGGFTTRHSNNLQDDLYPLTEENFKKELTDIYISN